METLESEALVTVIVPESVPVLGGATVETEVDVQEPTDSGFCPLKDMLVVAPDEPK